MSALPEEIAPKPRLLDMVDVVGEREGGLVECYVPVELICMEDVPVNEEHVEQLSSSIKEEAVRAESGTGQLSPVLLGEIEGEDQLRIIDGFHRCSALNKAGVPMVYATIRQSTWDEVIDLRILTARTHKTVQFARIVEWVNDSWDRTPWSAKLNVTQAFVLYRTLSSGRQLGISSDEAQGVQEWVELKCQQWKVSAASIYNHLSVASVADPQLVAEARSGNKDIYDYITPGHLKVIAKGLPLRFDVQRFVAATAKSRNLKIPETRSLANKLAACEDLAAAQEMVRTIDWATIQPEYSPRQTRRMAAETFGSLAVETTSRESVLRPAHTAVGNAKILLQRLLNDPSLPHEQAALVAAKKDVVSLGRGLMELTRLIDVILERSQPQRPPRLSLLETHRQVQAEESRPARPAPIAPAPKADLALMGDSFAGQLDDFLGGRTEEMPLITTRAHIRQAERALLNPSSCSLELREDLELALAEARQALVGRSR